MPNSSEAITVLSEHSGLGFLSDFGLATYRFCSMRVGTEATAPDAD
ncbi:MAG: hypothetical protein HOM16_04890 [Woeseia sp.]|nr:hypothetical protein [Woeseia sp.]